ncbi:hypothetical protein M8R91_22860, partial [Enterobacter roggenkampii]|uniref:hypothetical protein n=1 Tax=Enterobacter roggenkampii TaxID=1812935 RepID=UPI002075D08F
ADRNRSHWSTSKTPSYTKSVSWQHHQDLMKNSHNWLCTVNCPLSAKNQIKNNGFMKIKKDKV